MAIRRPPVWAPTMPDQRTPQEQLVLDFFRILSSGDLEAIRATLHHDALQALTALPNGAPLLCGMADWLVRRQY